MLEHHSSTRKVPLTFDKPRVRGLHCENCERAIPPNALFCPHCQAAILRRYCPGCAKLVPDTTDYCPYCGVSAADKVKHIKISHSTILTALACMSLVTLCLILIYRSSPTSTPTQAIANSKNANPTVAAIPAKVAVDATVSGRVQNIAEGTRLNLVGHRLLKEGRYNDAINVLRQALKTFPENSQDPSRVYAMYNLGHSLRRTGKPNEAIPLLLQCVQMDRENPMFHDELQAAKKAAVRNPS